LRKDYGRYGTEGDGCANRRETLKFLEFFYSSETTRSLAEIHGFAVLPLEVLTPVQKRMREDLLCAGEGSAAVYQPPDTIKVEAHTSAAMSDLVDLLASLYKVQDSFLVLEKILSDELADDFKSRDHPAFYLHFTDELVNAGFENWKNGALIDFTKVMHGILFNLCGTNEQCVYVKAVVRVTTSTLASILDGKITHWDNPAIVVESGEVLPHEEIVVIRAGSETGMIWESRFTEKLKEEVTGFTFAKETTSFDSHERLVSGVYATPWSIAVLPILFDANSQLSSLMLLDELPEEGYPGDDYKFYEEVALGLALDFKPSGSITQRTVISYASFVHWFLGSSVVDPIAQKGIVYVPNEDARLSEKFLVNWDGKAVLFENKNLVEPWQKSLVQALVAITICVAIGWAVLIHVKRRHLVIKYTSPVFLYQILFGVILSLVNCFLILMDDETRSLNEPVDDLTASCRVQTYVFMIGFGAVFTPLLLKTWRMNTIFAGSKKLTAVVITNKMLFKYETVILAIPTAINVAWQLSNPLYWIREVIKIDPISGVPLETIGRCQTANGEASGMLFIQLQILFIAASLFYGNYLSYKGRNVPTKFSEGKWSVSACIWGALFAFNSLILCYLCPSLLLLGLQLPFSTIWSASSSACSSFFQLGIAQPFTLL
jgi:hypothetical protein